MCDQFRKHAFWLYLKSHINMRLKQNSNWIHGIKKPVCMIFFSSCYHDSAKEHGHKQWSNSCEFWPIFSPYYHHRYMKLYVLPKHHVSGLQWTSHIVLLCIKTWHITTLWLIDKLNQIQANRNRSWLLADCNISSLSSMLHGHADFLNSTETRGSRDTY